MTLSKELDALCAWFINSETDILKNASDKDLRILAESLAIIADTLDNIAQSQNIVSVPNDENLLEEVAKLSEALDSSGNVVLQKYASVLDELLLTIAAPTTAIPDFKKAQEDKIEMLKKKYQETKKTLDDLNKVSDTLKAIEKSPMYKQYRPLEAPLSTRSCPDHPGAQISRLGEDMWQCSMDGKIYDFKSGFKMVDSSVVPGGDVQNQTEIKPEGHVIFDTRDSKLGQ